MAAWHPLGASITVPTSGGLGEYIQKNLSRLTPRHAPVIAAVIVRKNLIECRGRKPTQLRKLNTKQQLIRLRMTWLYSSPFRPAEKAFGSSQGTVSLESNLRLGGVKS